MTKKSIFFIIFTLCFIFIVVAQTNTTNLGDNSGAQGNNNTLVGSRSGQLTAANNNSFFGAFSGRFNTTGRNNSFFGSNAGRNNLDGNNNNFFGINAGNENISGVNNVYVGLNAGRYNQTGNNNVFIGHAAGIGPDDLSANNRLRNSYLGAFAGRNATGSGNVFLGFQAGITETENNRLHINNSETRVPLIYGDFSSGQLGINTTSLVSNMALSIGGNATVDGNFITNGKISIGTDVDDPGYDFTVKGKIHVQEVKVDLLGAIAPDYVFYDDYNLKTLEEVEAFIVKEGHLPNIPSANEMQKNGVNLKEMNLKLLEKIEELTLYILEQNTTLKEQEAFMLELEKRLISLASKLEED